MKGDIRMVKEVLAYDNKKYWIASAIGNDSVINKFKPTWTCVAYDKRDAAEIHSALTVSYRTSTRSAAYLENTLRYTFNKIMPSYGRIQEEWKYTVEPLIKLLSIQINEELADQVLAYPVKWLDEYIQHWNVKVYTDKADLDIITGKMILTPQGAFYTADRNLQEAESRLSKARESIEGIDHLARDSRVLQQITAIRDSAIRFFALEKTAFASKVKREKTPGEDRDPVADIYYNFIWDYYLPYMGLSK